MSPFVFLLPLQPQMVTRGVHEVLHEIRNVRIQLRLTASRGPCYCLMGYRRSASYRVRGIASLEGAVSSVPIVDMRWL